jgi:hypothetical protein
MKRSSTANKQGKEGEEKKMALKVLRKKNERFFSSFASCLFFL